MSDDSMPIAAWQAQCGELVFPVSPLNLGFTSMICLGKASLEDIVREELWFDTSKPWTKFLTPKGVQCFRIIMVRVAK